MAVEEVNQREAGPRRLRQFALAAGILALCFGRPLLALSGFALHHDLYSYILLVPCISLYLGWTNRSALPAGPASGRGISLVSLACGVALLAIHWHLARTRAALAPEDSLALLALAFVAFLTSLFAVLLGRAALNAMAFPLGFLVLLAPLPVAATDGIEMVLQHASAAVAHGFFALVGTPILAEGLIFRLSDITIEVAPQCSGIHSTLVLFITSLLAGYWFLQSPWRRTVLSLAVLPLAILRNGLRIFTIGELCVHIGPQMIDSNIHHHGGPIFFVASLVPFFLLLALLIKYERRRSHVPLPSVPPQHA